MYVTKSLGIYRDEGHHYTLAIEYRDNRDVGKQGEEFRMVARLYQDYSFVDNGRHLLVYRPR